WHLVDDNTLHHLRLRNLLGDDIRSPNPVHGDRWWALHLLPTDSGSRNGRRAGARIGHAGSRNAYRAIHNRPWLHGLDILKAATIGVASDIGSHGLANCRRLITEGGLEDLAPHGESLFALTRFVN